MDYLMYVCVFSMIEHLALPVDTQLQTASAAKVQHNFI